MSVREILAKRGAPLEYDQHTTDDICPLERTMRKVLSVASLAISILLSLAINTHTKEHACMHIRRFSLVELAVSPAPIACYSRHKRTNIHAHTHTRASKRVQRSRPRHHSNSGQQDSPSPAVMRAILAASTALECMLLLSENPMGSPTSSGNTI